MDIFLQRRFWIAVVPVAIMVANALGVPITEELLASTGDKVVTGAMGLVALWSYFQPKPPA